MVTEKEVVAFTERDTEKGDVAQDQIWCVAGVIKSSVTGGDVSVTVSCVEVKKKRAACGMLDGWMCLSREGN